jgi:hypothetical protein
VAQPETPKDWKNGRKKDNSCYWFRDLCVELIGHRTFDKHIPNFILNLTTEYKQSFLDYAIKMDGFYFSEHSQQIYRNNKRNNAFQFGTASSMAACGMYILCLQLGHEISLHTRVLKSGHLFYTLKTCVNPCREKTAKVKVTPIDYDGYAYDFSVPEGQMFSCGIGLLLLHNTDFGLTMLSNGYKVCCHLGSKIYHAMSDKERERWQAEDPYSLNQPVFLNKWKEWLKLNGK